MDKQRSAAVWAAINDHARADGGPVSIDTVCLVCARTLRAQGVSVALNDRLMGYEPVCASGPGAYRLMDLHVTLGEGPGRDALADDRPVLVGDLTDDGTRRRWPMFAPAAVQAGVRAIFVFPLLLGVISLGVLEISRAQRGWLTPQESADALVFADAALLVQVQRLASPDDAGEPKELRWGTVERWSPVHQATGMVAVQSGTDVSAAFARLRAYAFAEERSLLEVARDVVARRLRFAPDRNGPD
ncbi:GAF and ANTAR domain-containing protein [Sphaerisporangium sp. TRM90804]|uniref:GAF and ANTAR domain-containing protein n=1 Tax=Sphaerisporangium sp. TRM90804 TaxID=3031113 RepID=UPI00244AAA96|nr:GAF and ANTAR domain-containing protein [Sphaerisporangium sp. TRM90804]MDH2424228.1 GAF and ANTAR domain-containing protein [Sphaerisporangium sp. TRM90804]